MTTRTGAKFSAWPKPSFSTSTRWRRPDQPLQPRRPCAARRPRAARRARCLAIGGRDLRHAGGGRATLRRDRGRCGPSRCRIRRSAAAYSRPSRRSRSGSRRSDRRRSRSPAASPSAARPSRPRRARLWRRFIRFSTMSSPAWKLIWRCGMKRGSPVARSNSRSSISMQSSEERRRRGSSGTWRRMRSISCPERRRAGQIGAVAGHVDAGQHDLAEALADQRLDPLDDQPGRHRAAVPAAVGDDAEGAAMVAAILHLDERARALGEAGDEMRRRLAHRHDVGDADLRVSASDPARKARECDRTSRDCRAPAPPRASPRSVSGSTCAAQPVTNTRASGRARLALRIAWRVWRTASLVTAQLLTMTRSSSSAASARIASLSAMLRRQPRVITSTLMQRELAVKTWVAGPLIRIVPPGCHSMVSDAAGQPHLDRAFDQPAAGSPRPPSRRRRCRRPGQPRAALPDAQADRRRPRTRRR